MHPIKLLGACTFAALLTAPALAQQPSQRIRGTIESTTGTSITVKQADGADVSIKLADNVQVFGVVPATLADLKPGTYIGASAPCRSRTAAKRRSRSRSLPSHSAVSAKVSGRGIAPARP
jgi:hypothetical protein